NAATESSIIPDIYSSLSPSRIASGPQARRLFNKDVGTFFSKEQLGTLDKDDCPRRSGGEFLRARTVAAARDKGDG
ncbi:TPA: hypothetical protein ACH9MG_005780, partial [Escherichia coli]